MNIDVVSYQLCPAAEDPLHEQLRQIWTEFHRYDLVSPYLPTVEAVYLVHSDRFHILRTGHLARYLTPAQRTFLDQLKTWALTLYRSGCKKIQ